MLLLKGNNLFQVSLLSLCGAQKRDFMSPAIHEMEKMVLKLKIKGMLRQTADTVGGSFWKAYDFIWF